MNLINNGSSLINLTISKLALALTETAPARAMPASHRTRSGQLGSVLTTSWPGPTPSPCSTAAQRPSGPPRQFQPLGALPVGPENEGRSVTMATAPVLQHVVHRLVGKLNSHRLNGWDTS